MVGTELVMELGGASMPAGCSGGSGGGGPVCGAGTAKYTDILCIQQEKKTGGRAGAEHQAKTTSTVSNVNKNMKQFCGFRTVAWQREYYPKIKPVFLLHLILKYIETFNI